VGRELYCDFQVSQYKVSTFLGVIVTEAGDDAPTPAHSCSLYVGLLSICILLTHTKVMLLEVDLAGENAKEDPIYGEKTVVVWKKMTKAKVKVLEDIKAAGAFLERHEIEKIVVSIDTHCLKENGLLV